MSPLLTKYCGSNNLVEKMLLNAAWSVQLSNLHRSLVRNLWAGGCPSAAPVGPRADVGAYIQSARNKIEQQAAEVDHNIRPKGLLSRCSLFCFSTRLLFCRACTYSDEENTPALISRTCKTLRSHTAG